jgi:peptide/nickel transport system substrate-binding protein
LGKSRQNKIKRILSCNSTGCCGPYKFKEWKRAERVELVRNPLFYGEKAKTDGIIYDITPSNTTSLVKVETQEDNFAAVPESDVARMKTIPSLYVKTVTGTTFDYLVYNMKTPFFSDKRVRQAISYTVNRDAIIKGIYKGIGKPASGSYVPALWCYNPNVKKYTYNLTLAKQLMDQAGWKVGKDGYRYKDGKRFEVTMLTNQGNKMREKAVVLLQSQLKPLGIKVNPRILDWNTMWSSYIDIGKFDCYYSGFITGIDGDQTVMFNSDKNIGSFNRGGYANKRVDELYELARKTFNRDEQKKYYFEAQQLIADDCPMTFVIYRSNSYVFNKKVQNTQVYDLLTYYNMHTWTVTQ